MLREWMHFDAFGQFCSAPQLGCILMAAWREGSSLTSEWAMDGVFGEVCGTPAKNRT